MMNAIAIQLMNFLLRAPLMTLRDSGGTFLPQSERLPRQVWLPRLVPQTLLHAGAIIAVVLAVLFTSSFGERRSAIASGPSVESRGLPSCGNQRAGLPGARTDAGRRIAGLAGVFEVIGVQHRLMDGITSGYGFSGIVAALFGGLHPLGLIPASGCSAACW